MREDRVWEYGTELRAKLQYLSRLQSLTYGGIDTNNLEYAKMDSQSTLCAIIYKNVTFKSSSYMSYYLNTNCYSFFLIVLESREQFPAHIIQCHMIVLTGVRCSNQPIVLERGLQRRKILQAKYCSPGTDNFNHSAPCHHRSK